ncbi:MAG: hypothetical protein WC961_07150 [Anaerovoracaceae bacterium]
MSQGYETIGEYFLSLREPIPYTNEERYIMLVERNPEINSLVEQLGLVLDDAPFTDEGWMGKEETE